MFRRVAPDAHCLATEAANSAVTVQVTATRFGEPIEEVPGSVSVVTGDEMRARAPPICAHALALLAAWASHRAAMPARRRRARPALVCARWTTCCC